ncbi:major facilitator superfamily domain-containing protein [Halteromyces radiatus]|uniref:major facilitator superfamily domain-containing protein n=1 Tax=Halteromyces radiatus TaxID=101107 RepID=UPI00221E4E7A|nr:major facilitator superfamily domain-containing protein [Halteromyces radiatus]KAI8082845.1 major facilitator superfamily domain-containing protein [Halteromyces radiatus]
MDTEQTPLLRHHQQIISSTPCCKGRNDIGACCSTAINPPSSSLDNNDNQNSSYCQLSDQPWKYKSIALLCALFLAVGSHFAAHTLGAMKNTIKQEFDISNSQYGVLQSSVAIVNTVLPMLGGVFIDAFGTVPGSVCATLLITSGNILVALSTHSASWNIMVTGRVLYGIGSGSVVIVQETILSQWFRGRSLAAVVALMLTVSRLASFLAQATVVPIANWSGWYGYGFWFSALLCLFSLVINLIYIALLHKVSPVSNVDQCRNIQTIKQKKAFHWSKLLYLPHGYWIVVLIEFLLGGSWGTFLHINSELVKFRFGYDNADAAAIASVAQVLPIFFMPLLGVFVDRYGKRTLLMIGSGLTFTLAMYLLDYTQWHPLMGMLSFSLSLALGPVGLVSSVPVLLPLSFVGTGMGLIKCSTNIGASLFDILTGWIQDQDTNKGYSGVVIFFLAVGILSTLAGLVLWILDRTCYSHLLDQSAVLAQRREKMDLNTNKYDAMEDTPLKMNYLYGAILLGLMMTSWGLFFRFIIYQ